MLPNTNIYDAWREAEPEEREQCECGASIDPARGGLCRDCASLRAAELRGEQV